MKSVIESNEVGIFTPLDKMDKQFKSKSCKNISQLKEETHSDEAAEPNDQVYQHITNRSSFNLQRYFTDEAGFGTIRSSMLGGTHNE